MALKIKADARSYKSDQIANGRIIKDFFLKLARNVFNQSYAHYKACEDIAEDNEMPLWFPERNMYSHFAVAINKITKIHLSELSFNKSDHFSEEEYKEQSVNNRRVDYWCLAQNGEVGNKINYYIELKKGWFSSSDKSAGDFQKQIKDRYKSLISQLDELQKFKPNFYDYDDVYMGIFVVSNFHAVGKEFFQEKDILKKFKEMAAEHKDQYLVSTWALPEDVRTHDEGYEYPSISLFGVVRSVPAPKVNG